MKKYTFPMGGIHLDKHKLTSGMPIIPAGLPEFVYIPVRQHIGAPASPIVNQGDTVTAGQMIAEPAKGLSVGIHASIDGVVKEVSEKYVIIETQEGRAGK